jgi:(1->4)-alpha-D-glucan 1-alpha-D-glucosylmutase
MIAYARQDSENSLIVVAPRLMLEGTSWAETSIPLPESLAHRHYRNLLSGATLALNEQLSLDNLPPYAPLVLIAS